MLTKGLNPFSSNGKKENSSAKNSIREMFGQSAATTSKPHPTKVAGFYKVKELLRSESARTRYDLDSLMFHVVYPHNSGLDDEFLSYDDIKHTDAWKKYEQSMLTPRIGKCIGIDFDDQEIICYKAGKSVDLKAANYEARYLHDRKRRNDGDEIATSHTPKKVCRSAVFIPPPPPTSSRVNVFPQEVINELKDKFDKHTVHSPAPPPPQMTEAPRQKGLVQFMERNRNSPSYSTSRTSQSTIASRRNNPLYSTSATSIGSNLSNFDTGSLASTASSNFSSSFIPKGRQQKPDDGKCSVI